MLQRLLAVLFVLNFVLATGCARYQYSIVEPAAFAEPLVRKDELIVPREPLAYGFTDLNRTLGVRIWNESDDPIALLGERSYVVDPSGATHPLRGGTIAPQSYIAFTLPPVVRVYRGGPRLGVGVGVGTYGTTFGTGIGTTWGAYPSGYYDPVTAMNVWEWGTGIVRMRAVYDVADERIEHDFVFERERVD